MSSISDGVKVDVGGEEDAIRECLQNENNLEFQGWYKVFPRYLIVWKLLFSTLVR